MEILIDHRTNLTALRHLFGHNTMAIRRALILAGFTFAVANRYAMFAVYGPRDPSGRPTLTLPLYQQLQISYPIHYN